MGLYDILEDMENFNKILSFILGLVVIIVFLAIITGRFKPGKSNQLSQNKISAYPTKSVNKANPVVTGTMNPGTTTTTSTYHPYQQNQTSSPASIPSTGLPTEVLPFLFSTLGLGVYLRKKV